MFKTNEDRYNERNHRSGKIITPVTYEEKDIVDKYGHVQVAMQDQFTPMLILPMVQQLGLTTLALDTIINAYTMQVTSATGFVIGQHIRIINSLADRFYTGTILGIAGTIITVDNPFDFAYLAGSEVTISNINLAVDGSITPVIFTLRTGAPSIPSSVDITKLLIVCETDGEVDLNKFGDLGILDRGLLFRSINGDQHNIFNIKSNRDFAGISTKFTPFTATNPAQGINGFSWEFAFNGQHELGVTQRVDQFGNLEMLVQDDLLLIISLSVFLEGHVVE